MKRGQIKKLFEKWTYLLGLRWWNVTITYVDDPEEIIRTFRVTDDEICVAKSYCDWRYATCNIYVNFPQLKQMDKKQIVMTIVHELCHALVNEMRENGIDHEERVVTGLAKAFLWTEGGLDD